MIQDLRLVLGAMRSVLPYLDRDGDGNTLYLVTGSYRDFREDIKVLEGVIHRMERIAPLVPE